MFSSSLTLKSLALLAVVSSAVDVAYATSLVVSDLEARRDVVAPKIITPNGNTVWPVGSEQLVTWDILDLPPDEQITNPIGKVILGYDENSSLNLDFFNPIVQGFLLRDGNVTLTVPNVVPKTNYLIVLYGNSVNTSPNFAITAS
ncbi:hypothetical protein CVT24_003498 [Panaeolus cyanescens]|uniref:Uncharacterized protein n=1 Tax=Panaeolus cyanescens TaxID=181874 RepID=A0A409WMX2_9AGAR|nr:hypothetical protein CVT24_003498 [Panaeolus cyanescens]